MRSMWEPRKLAGIAFISGFIMMSFELIGARLLAPTIGSSTYVWTSVIGVIIGALSTGYFLGGRLADRRDQVIDVVFLCLGVAIAIAAMLVTFDQTMDTVTDLFEDQRLRGVFASLALFAPTSLLLGMLSPYLAKLNVTSLSTSGQSVARLSALNSIGGITGTFVTGFIVFSYIGSREALIIITLLAVVSSWVFVPKIGMRLRVLLSVVAIAAVILSLLPGSRVVRIDTPSAHYEVKTINNNGAQPLRYLTTGPNAAQSGIVVARPDDLAFWYTHEIARVVAQAPARKSILVLGGGAFTLPRYFAKTYPDSQIDVVEIDPDLPTIATRYFDYDAPKNVTVIADDARAYSNTTTRQYDIVVVDVYSDTSVPFSLLTKEFGQVVSRLITPNGTVLVNAIASQTGPCEPMLQAIDQTYRTLAPNASLSRTPKTVPGERTNLVLAYTKDARNIAGMRVFDSLPGPTYTDNFMPAERLQQTCQSAATD